MRYLTEEKSKGKGLRARHGEEEVLKPVYQWIVVTRWTLTRGVSGQFSWSTARKGAVEPGNKIARR